MADAKISALTNYTPPLDADVIPVVDTANVTTKKVTWANIKATLKTYLDTLYQPVDSDLTTIAGLTATTDNFIQSKSSAWASRTIAQVKTDLGLTGTNSGDETTSTLGATINGAGAATPNDTDLVATVDTSVVKKITWTNVKAFLKTYFDTLYLATASYDDATSAETNTGTSTAKYVSPDGLAGSYAGTKSLSVQCFEGATDVTTGDGKAYITIPEALNGMNLVRAQATVVTAGTTNATTVMIHNKTDTQDMLSGAISIASAGTVGTVGTVNASFDDVATNDVLRIDVDSVSTTAPKGLMVVLEFRLP